MFGEDIDHSRTARTMNVLGVFVTSAVFQERDAKKRSHDEVQYPPYFHSDPSSRSVLNGGKQGY